MTLSHSPTELEFEMYFPAPSADKADQVERSAIRHAKACGAVKAEVLKTTEEWNLSVRFAEGDEELFVRYCKQFPGHEKAFQSFIAQRESEPDEEELRKLGERTLKAAAKKVGL